MTTPMPPGRTGIPPGAMPPGYQPPVSAGSPTPMKGLDVAALIRRGAGKAQGLRFFLYGTEGLGKTTLAAHAPSPLFVVPPSDDGVVTLLGAASVPDVPWAGPSSWGELLRLLEHVESQPELCETLVLDGVGGFEDLCRHHVIATSYGGDQEKFLAYGRGFETLKDEWVGLLGRLDRIRKLGKTIFLVGHAEVRPAKNPLVAEPYDEFIPDLDKRVWLELRRWLDVVLFGTIVPIKTDQGVTTVRVLYSEHGVGYTAKSRVGLPREIKLGPDHAANWRTLTGKDKKA